MNTVTEENYLKALHHLADELGEVNVGALSKHLNLKMPTVTSMMKKLADKELVHYESYKPLKLTEKGVLKARMVIRKHRLTEIFLEKVMGFSWEEVHEIAEQIEHINSPLFFDKMDELLEYPKADPHGSPIPNREGELVMEKLRKFSDCLVNETVEICAVTNTTSGFLQHLNLKAITLGTVVTITNVDDYDKTVTVSYNEKTTTISAMVGGQLLVR
jgi:DtxR family Mn-dependent transcriptional regulator